MSIHGEHPFLPPESERNPVRRLRGRLTAPVTLWTAGSGATRAGLPVSSVLVVDGEPGHVIGLIDPETELWDVAEPAGRFAISVLTRVHKSLSESFAGTSPAPGGPFRLAEWQQTEWGPVPTSVSTWAGCRITNVRTLGWYLVVEAELVHIELGPEGTGNAESSEGESDVAAEQQPLLHRRGRYLLAEPYRP